MQQTLGSDIKAGDVVTVTGTNYVVQLVNEGVSVSDLWTQLGWLTVDREGVYEVSARADTAQSQAVTLAERLDAAQTGEEFGAVVLDLFGWTEA